MHAKMPEEKLILFKLKDKFVDIMCSINEEYLQHVHYENGRNVSYLQVAVMVHGYSEYIGINLFRNQ